MDSNACGLPHDKRCSIIDAEKIAKILPMGGGVEGLFKPESYTINVLGTEGEFDPLYRAGHDDEVDDDNPLQNPVNPLRILRRR